MEKQTVYFTETVLSEACGAYLDSAFPLMEIEQRRDELKTCGYYALEVMNREVFRACLRDIGEDPWARLRRMHRMLGGVRLQARMKGREGFGSAPLPDSVLRRFVRTAVQCGVSVVAVYDEDDNFDNIRAMAEEAVHEGAELHCEITLKPASDPDACFYFAKSCCELGASYLVLSDPNGAVAPGRVAALTALLREKLGAAVGIRCSCKAGMAYMSCLKAVESGASLLESCVSPFSGGVCLPATETMFCTLREFGYDVGLQEAVMYRLAESFKPLRAASLADKRMDPLDMGVNTDAIHVREKAAAPAIGNEADLLPFDLYQSGKAELGELFRREEDVLSLLAVPEEAETYRKRLSSRVSFSLSAAD